MTIIRATDLSRTDLERLGRNTAAAVRQDRREYRKPTRPSTASKEPIRR